MESDTNDGVDAERPNSEPAWYDAAFGAHYPDVYAHRDLASAGREVGFLRSLGLGNRVLDLCCGWGRHAAHLVRAGLQVVAVDRSIELLRRAALLPEGEGSVRGRLVRADMSRLPFREQRFDAVLNLFSSFGYLGDAEDRRTLSELQRVLVPGGTAILDLMHPAWVRRELVPRSEREEAGFRLVEERWFESDGSRVVKEVCFTPRGQSTRTWREVVRLYELDECRSMLADVGLHVEHAFGEFRRVELQPDSPRMLLVARKES